MTSWGLPAWLTVLKEWHVLHKGVGRVKSDQHLLCSLLCYHILVEVNTIFFNPRHPLHSLLFPPAPSHSILVVCVHLSHRNVYSYLPSYRNFFISHLHFRATEVLSPPEGISGIQDKLERHVRERAFLGTCEIMRWFASFTHMLGWPFPQLPYFLNFRAYYFVWFLHFNASNIRLYLIIIRHINWGMQWFLCHNLMNNFFRLFFFSGLSNNGVSHNQGCYIDKIHHYSYNDNITLSRIH